MMKRLFVFSVAMMLFITANVFAQNPDSIVGEWFTDEGKSIVEVYKCSEFYCGKIVWLKNPKNEGRTTVWTKKQ
ncbi:MAG: DUF2147 domain-containing protein [Nitrospira sp.]|nr:DUF2147 domain-containing protein [Nitrospira sp.]